MYVRLLLRCARQGIERGDLGEVFVRIDVDQAMEQRLCFKLRKTAKGTLEMLMLMCRIYANNRKYVLI